MCVPLPPLLQPNASHQRRAGTQEPGPRRLLPRDSESFHAARSCLGSHKTSPTFIHPFVHPHCLYIIWAFSLVWRVVPFTADLPSFPFVLLQGASFFPFSPSFPSVYWRSMSHISLVCQSAEKLVTTPPLQCSLSRAVVCDAFVRGY